MGLGSSASFQYQSKGIGVLPSLGEIELRRIVSQGVFSRKHGTFQCVAFKNIFFNKVLLFKYKQNKWYEAIQRHTLYNWYSTTLYAYGWYIACYTVYMYLLSVSMCALQYHNGWKMTFGFVVPHCRKIENREQYKNWYVVMW